MWNLKNKTNEQTGQNRNKLTDTESKLIDTKGDEKGKLEAWG